MAADAAPGGEGMITYLRGEIAAVEEKRLVLDVNGIGYQIGISSRDSMNMPAVGESVKIHTYMNVREDAISLSGFLDESDLAMYRLLIGVSGVGQKVGLAILSVMNADQVAIAVVTDDSKAIAKAPGVGPKLAKKIILELKDRVDAARVAAQAEEKISASNSEFEKAKEEAVDVLTALGYSRSEAVRAVRSARLTEDMDSDQILTAALADRR